MEKNEKISRKTLMKRVSEGGVGMINIKTYMTKNKLDKKTHIETGHME